MRRGSDEGDELLGNGLSKGEGEGVGVGGGRLGGMEEERKKRDACSRCELDSI